MSDEKKGNGNADSGNNAHSTGEKQGDRSASGTKASREQFHSQLLSKRLEQLEARLDEFASNAADGGISVPLHKLKGLVGTARDAESTDIALAKLRELDREMSHGLSDDAPEQLKKQIVQIRAEASALRLVTEAVWETKTLFKLPEVVVPTTLQERPLRLAREETPWAKPRLGTYRPYALEEGDGEEQVLRPIQTVGKVRLKVRGGEDGASLPHAAYRIVADDSNGEQVVLGEGATNKYGYAVTDLSNVEREGLFRLRVELKKKKKHRAGNDGSNVRDRDSAVMLIEDTQYGSNGSLGVPHDFAVGPDIADKIERVAEDGLIVDPDARDLINSPESFVFDTQLEDGNCTIRPGGGVATREFFFQQIIRRDSPALVQRTFNKRGIDRINDFALSTEKQDSNTKWTLEDVIEDTFSNSLYLDDISQNRTSIAAPIPYGSESVVHALRAGQVQKGIALMYKQGWHATRLGLGQPLYSLALAPCEEINLSIIDWSREEEAVRREFGEASERLSHELYRNRTIDEAVNGVVRETQRGGSASGGGGIGVSIGPISIGGGGGASSSWSKSTRKTAADTMQRISDRVVQEASSLRGLRSTVITTSRQTESERIETRAVRNHNKNRAMTVQYSQVYTHYSVRTQVVDTQEVLLVPYDIDPVFFAPLAPSFEVFRASPDTPLTEFLLQNRSAIEPLLSAKYREVYAELAKLVHCQEVYQLEEPHVTASRWRVELIDGWRPGVRLYIETEDGGNYPLRPSGAKEGRNVADFESGPVRLDKVSAVRITFDPGDAIRDRIEDYRDLEGLYDALGEAWAKHIEQTAGQYDLKEIAVYARTDPSPYLPDRQTYRLGVGEYSHTTLSLGSPLMTISVSPPLGLQEKLEGSFGPAHQTFCQMQELVAYLQERPMEVMRAIWLSEDPDRRAMRLDRYNVHIFKEMDDPNFDSILEEVPLLDVIENQPVGVVGNLVAFPYLNGGELEASADIDTSVHERLVSLPTPGVFAEVFLSACSATERRDISRVVDDATSCSGSAPAITGITPGSRRASPDVSPSGFPTPMVNIQNPPAAPDPQGMAGVLQLLSTPEIFRDMSLGEETVNAVRDYVAQAMENAARNGGAGQGTGTSGNGAAEGVAGSTVNRAIDAATGAAVRNSDPVRTYDQLQNIERAQKSGLLSGNEANKASRNVLGATSEVSSSSGNAGDATSKTNDGEVADIELRSVVIDKLPDSNIRRQLVAQIFFKTGEPGSSDKDDLLSSLGSDDRAVLDYLLDPNWSHWGESTWEIYGYADARPDHAGENPDLNMLLSQNRARSVATYLFSNDSDSPIPDFDASEQLVVKGFGDQFSDPNQPEQFPYDRLVNIYVSTGMQASDTEDNLPFAREDIEAWFGNEMKNESRRLGQISEEDSTKRIDTRIRAYAIAMELVDMLESGDATLSSPEVPGMANLRAMITEVDNVNAHHNLDKLVNPIIPALSGLKEPRQDYESDHTRLIGALEDQQAKRQYPLYRIATLSPNEGKDFANPSFFRLGDSPETLDDFPPAFSDLEEDRKNALLEQGVKEQDYVSGAEHRERIQPYLDHRQELVNQAKQRLNKYPNLRLLLRNPKGHISWWAKDK